MDVDELSTKIDKYHEDDLKREKIGKYENLGFIALAFAASATSFVYANPDTIARLITAAMAGFLLITGLILGFKAFVSKKR